ncbi:MAG: N-acetylglucosamine-6-phosphate deacetylase [Oscillospiraceae bacterium]
MIIKNGNVFLPDGHFHKTNIEITDSKISSLGMFDGSNSIEASDMYVIPGFFDIHIHGAMNCDFSDGTDESIDNISEFLFSNGVTNFLGTTMALPPQTLKNIFSNAGHFVGKQRKEHSTLRGINMEGPFFSKEKRGAQNENNIIDPDLNLFYDLMQCSGNSILLCDIAPELNGSDEFIVNASKITSVSLAHTCADYNTAKSAFTCGANHVTHLFNGMSPFGHRDPGVVGAAADAGAYVELISDGMHVHPSIIRAVFNLFGNDRVCLISDSMRACGMPDGEYDLGGLSATVSGGCARISTGSLAGSTTCLTDCMRKAVSFGIPLESAIKACTINPAKSVGLEKMLGLISVGRDADLLILDKDLNLLKIIQRDMVFTL